MAPCKNCCSNKCYNLSVFVIIIDSSYVGSTVKELKIAYANMTDTGSYERSNFVPESVRDRYSDRNYYSVKRKRLIIEAAVLITEHGGGDSYTFRQPYCDTYFLTIFRG
jgi:hypothetical protein